MMISLLLYLVPGVLFAIVFVTKLAGKLDPGARDGTWGFRLAILPGSIVLWPLLLWLTVRRLR